MEGKGTYFILLLIVAILTLTLAVLAGYLFIAGSSPRPASANTQQNVTAVPDIKNLGTKPIYDEKQYFNLKSQGSSKAEVIEIQAELVYFTNVKIKNIDARIDYYMGQIRELMSRYFMNLTMDDVQKPETIERAKKELAGQINDLLNSGEREKKNIIWSINFDRWFYAP